jgi:hypothetical protein
MYKKPTPRKPLRPLSPQDLARVTGGLKDADREFIPGNPSPAPAENTPGLKS